MDLKDKLTIASLVVALSAVITKMKAFETWLDECMKRWAANRSARATALAQKLPDVIWERARTSGRDELETLALVLKEEHKADRVTVAEFTPNPDESKKGLLITILHEERTSRMPSVLNRLQQAPLLPEIEAEILRIHAQECHCLYVRVARLVELPAMRAALVASGVSSVYYQTLPAAAGHAGGLLSISWKDEKDLNAQDLAALHFSGISLGSVLRMLWELKPPAAP